MTALRNREDLGTSVHPCFASQAAQQPPIGWVKQAEMSQWQAGTVTGDLEVQAMPCSQNMQYVANSFVPFPLFSRLQHHMFMCVCWRDAVQEQKHREGPQVALPVCVIFWKLLASKALVGWVFVAVARHSVDFGNLICLLSLAVQALKLGRLGLIIVVDVGRGGRGAAGEGGKADAAAGLLYGTLCLPCPDEQDFGMCWSQSWLLSTNAALLMLMWEC